MNRTLACSLAVALLISIAPLARAQSSGMGGMDMKDKDKKGMQSMEMKGEKSEKKGKAQTHHASGTVTKVDPAKGSMTVAHGAVQSMNWPAMSMTFKLKDKAMLDKIKQGDKVEFSFVQSGKAGKDYTITEVK